MLGYLDCTECRKRSERLQELADYKFATVGQVTAQNVVEKDLPMAL